MGLYIVIFLAVIGVAAAIAFVVGCYAIATKPDDHGGGP